MHLGMFVADLFKSRSRLEAENLFLRHQLSLALRQKPPRIRLRAVIGQYYFGWSDCGRACLTQSRSFSLKRIALDFEPPGGATFAAGNALSTRLRAWSIGPFVPAGAWSGLPSPQSRQISEAFPWNEAPRYLIRDRDRVYGTMVTRRVRAMGIRHKPIACGSDGNVSTISSPAPD